MSNAADGQRKYETAFFAQFVEYDETASPPNNLLAAGAWKLLCI